MLMNVVHGLLWWQKVLSCRSDALFSTIPRILALITSVQLLQRRLPLLVATCSLFWKRELLEEYRVQDIYCFVSVFSDLCIYVGQPSLVVSINAGTRLRNTTKRSACRGSLTHNQASALHPQIPSTSLESQLHHSLMEGITIPDKRNLRNGDASASCLWSLGQCLQ